MSASTSTGIGPLKPGYQKLKDLIKENTVVCKFDNREETRVIVPDAIDKIATPEHIRDFVTTNQSGLKDLNPKDQNDLIQRLETNARRLFVLVIDGEINGMFLHSMVMGANYTDPVDKDCILEMITPCFGDFLTLKDAIRKQAAVCAPKIKLGSYDQKVLREAFPFRVATENSDRKQTRGIGIGESKMRMAWDVELGNDFQDGHFGTTDLVLTQHMERPEATGYALAGFECSDAYYYLLWKRVIS